MKVEKPVNFNSLTIYLYDDIISLGYVGTSKNNKPFPAKSVFDGHEMNYPLTHLTLSDVKKFDGGAVWLRYSAK